MQMDAHLNRDADDVIGGLGRRNARFEGKTILLTGAAGFLGAQFVHFFLALNDKRLLARPCRVVAVDNLMRGVPHWLAAARERRDVSVVHRSVTDGPLDFGTVDFVIHAASVASPTYYRMHPLETMDANVIGLRNLLEMAVRRPVESFLFLSSSEIYGDPDPGHIPTAEDYRGNVSCTGPRACYDESKRYGETLCVNYAKVHGTPVKIARPFNNYGPGLGITDRRVLPDLFRDILADRDIVLLSDGAATRTFCYATDAITGYVLALLSGHNGESFNIGSDRPEISIRQLAVQVVNVTGTKRSIVFGSDTDPKYLVDNPQRRCPNISKAKRCLGFDPKVSLEEGLSRLYAYYLDNPEGTGMGH